VLCAKYVLCHSLYVVITVLEIVRGDVGNDIAAGGDDDMEPTIATGWWEMYITALFLTDISNVLCVLHCATNWMLFYDWPMPRYGK
jgi:hypothetical protein